MNLLFKNVTKYSKTIYDDFLKFHTKKFSFRYHLFSLAISMIFLFFIMLHISYHHYGLAIIFCACLTSFILWRYFHPIEEVQEDYNSDKVTKEYAFTFSFYNKYFKVYSKRQYSVIHYADLYKIFETDTFFYLYLDSRHSLLLNKSGFKKGTPIEFRNFIKKKCPFKYKLDKTKMDKET